MATDALTSREYWRSHWDDVRLPVIKQPSADVSGLLATFLPKGGHQTFLEVGCAPGAWMAYFHCEFGYQVSGIEYVEEAAATTRTNLEMQGIEARVITADLFEYEPENGGYDVVYSGGLIEHFEDQQGVVSKVCSLSTDMVLTQVPHLLGLNGLIRKVARPGIFKTHMPVSCKALRQYHEACGLTTLFCDCVNGVQFTPPAGEGRRLFEKHPALTRLINLPVRAVNKASRWASARLGVFPRWRFASNSLLYIGRRAPTASDAGAGSADGRREFKESRTDPETRP